MKNIRTFYLKIYLLVVKFSVYLNRRVFVIRMPVDIALFRLTAMFTLKSLIDSLSKQAKPFSDTKVRRV